MKDHTVKNNYDIKIACIGGDSRHIYSAKNLAQAGLETAVYGFDNDVRDIGLCTRCDLPEDALELADVLLLPMPVSADGKNIHMPLSKKTLSLSRVFEKLSPKTLVMYGGKCPALMELAEAKGIRTINYYDREDYKIAGAIPTAEGAVAIALDELAITLNDATCLVIGYGRIGKVLAGLLKSFGANVYASARKSADIEWAKVAGLHTVKTKDIKDVIPRCDVIFNTVPQTVLDENVLGAVQKETLLIDLASKPGGIDFDIAKSLGLHTVWALSLPGKTAPISAGKILSDTVLEILREEV